MSTDESAVGQVRRWRMAAVLAIAIAVASVVVLLYAVITRPSLAVQEAQARTATSLTNEFIDGCQELGGLLWTPESFSGGDYVCDVDPPDERALVELCQSIDDRYRQLDGSAAYSQAGASGAVCELYDPFA